MPNKAELEIRKSLISSNQLGSETAIMGNMAHRYLVPDKIKGLPAEKLTRRSAKHGVAYGEADGPRPTGYCASGATLTFFAGPEDARVALNHQKGEGGRASTPVMAEMKSRALLIAGS